MDEGGGGGVARGADDGARQAAWTTAFGEGAGNFSRTPAHANVEQFGTFDTAFQKLFSARDGIAAAGPTGYPGREGLFTTQAFIDDTLGGGDGGDGAANGSSSGGGLDAGWWRTWTDARARMHTGTDWFSHAARVLVWPSVQCVHVRSFAERRECQLVWPCPPAPEARRRPPPAPQASSAKS